MAIDRTKMGQLHEEYAAQMLGGAVTRGSGNQWQDPNDTRDNHLSVPFALSVQCKSTLGSGLTITREIRDKAVQESGGELPAIALRWYPNERLDHLSVNDDWTALRTADLSEILATARRLVEFETRPAMVIRMRDDWTDEETEQFAREMDRLMESGEWKRGEMKLRNADLPIYNAAAGLPESGLVAVAAETIRQFQAQIELLGRELQSASRTLEDQARQPDPEPVALDTTVVYSMHTGGEPRMAHQGVHIGPMGHQEPFTVESLRIERSADNRPRMFVNDTLVQRGRYYLDGRLVAQVGIEPVIG